MPRSPVDGKKVIEHRISLGTYERNMLNDIALSYRIQAISPKVIMDVLDDPTKVIQIAYSIATIFEMFGMETGLPTVADLPEVITWFTQRGINQSVPRSPDNPSGWELLQKLWSGELGGFKGGY